MDDMAREKKLKEVQDMVRARIDAGREAGVVLWQAALESMLIAVSPYLASGEMVTVSSMGPEASARFNDLQRMLDFSPFVCGVFLPPEQADTLSPEGIVAPLARASKGSMKILVTRAGDFSRIMTVEIAPGSPGIDIFEDGRLLGSYDYDSPEACMADISKTVWIHLKHKGTWTAADCIRYTDGWFLKSVACRASDLAVNPNHSYIHSPTLLKLTPVEAVFKLMDGALAELSKDPKTVLAWANAAGRGQGEAVSVTRDGLARKHEEEIRFLEICLEDQLLSLLKLLYAYDIVDFRAFSDADERKFKDRFDRTVKGACERFIATLS